MSRTAGVLTIHNGKGKKDRTVPLPQSIVPQLKEQIEALKRLHQEDLENGYGGAFMVGLLDKKLYHFDWRRKTEGHYEPED